ncbi:MAG: hypothetical protein ACPG7B_11945 [Pseudomonadales bacterium]
MTHLLHAADEAEALEMLHAKGLTDGLPVVIPTAERVDRLVLATGLQGAQVLGEMGPGGGAATVEKVAVSAVMAGCLPDHMPAVLAAIKAILQPQFDLTEMQATTHCTAPLIIVNGPARLACGDIASGFGALGPGFRANASIGRAVRLAMRNIGGAHPGVSDMALLGHPGKFSYCLAEDEESSPFDPLHVSMGYNIEQSTVTVLGAEAPHSVMYAGDADSSDDHLRLLTVLAIGLGNLATNNAILTGGAATVVLNPEHAAILAAGGLSRSDICQDLFERCGHTAEAIRAVNPGFSSGSKPQSFRRCFQDPSQIIVLVAGGSGLYSMVMPSWCAGAHRNAVVTEEIVLNDFCEIPD